MLTERALSWKLLHVPDVVNILRACVAPGGRDFVSVVRIHVGKDIRRGTAFVERSCDVILWWSDDVLGNRGENTSLTAANSVGISRVDKVPGYISRLDHRLDFRKLPVPAVLIDGDASCRCVWLPKCFALTHLSRTAPRHHGDLLFSCIRGPQEGADRCYRRN